MAKSQDTISDSFGYCDTCHSQTVSQYLIRAAHSNYKKKKRMELDLSTASSGASLAKGGGAPLPAPPMFLGGMKLRFLCTANLSLGVQPDAAAVAAATAARFCTDTIRWNVFTMFPEWYARDVLFPMLYLFTFPQNKESI